MAKKALDETSLLEQNFKMAIIKPFKQSPLKISISFNNQNSKKRSPKSKIEICDFA